jgi:hypothetical protein|tara:strand:+ start:3621 stop:4178 length:558 start_codon:yes stop_codon:yes gene_type:complete
MKIENTELEYSDAEEIFIDYYLGKHCETKDEWAQRVWKNCARWKKGLRTTEEGGKLSSVYSRDPKSIWEEKKRLRRSAFVIECTNIKCDPSLLCVENIDQALSDGCECEWPESHCDAKIFALKEDPQYQYRTACEHFDKEKKEYEEARLLKETGTKESIEKLRAKNFDDETIGIIFPQAAPYLSV